MSVEVRVPTMLRPHTGGDATVHAEGETVGQALEHLVGRFPGLGGSVVTDQGALHKFVNVYVNDDDIRYLNKLDTKVGPSDVISILPAVAGGAS